MNRIALLVVIGFVAWGLPSASGQKAGTHAASERALRQVDAEWAAAAQARNFEKVLSYYSATAIELPPNAPMRLTKKAIRKGWQELIETPGASLNWRPVTAGVSESRDLGYITGTYEYSRTNAAGQKIVVDRGKYLEVMRKIDDGSWKCVAVSWNSDLPASSSSSPKQ